MGFASFFKNFSKDETEKKDTESAPATTWVKCPGCNALMYYKEVAAQHNVCPKCNYHLKISLTERIAMLCDEDSLEKTKSYNFERRFCDGCLVKQSADLAWQMLRISRPCDGFSDTHTQPE